ncbi:MAG: carbonic anhydrase [Candidatus Micrarchaeia archaeon]
MAVEKLLEGNMRFRSQPAQKDLAKMRAETLDGQAPYAIVLTCSDSRVPPEHIFDAGIGAIFVIRNAGNVADKVALGSIEYAAEHLHTPLLVVMGHEKCGAVKAAWELPEGQHAEGNIADIVKKIEKSVKKMKKKGKDIEDAARENVKNQMKTILRKSAICKKLVEEGKLKIVGAKYKLSDGSVEFF